MTRENSGVAPEKFRNTASYKIKWRQDYIELKYLRKKTRIFGSPMAEHEYMNIHPPPPPPPPINILVSTLLIPDEEPFI